MSIETMTPEVIEPSLWERLEEEEKSKGREDIGEVSLTYWQDVWRRLRRNKIAILGLVIIVALIISAVLGPYFIKHNYYEQDLSFVNIPPAYEIYDIDGQYAFMNKNMNLYEADKDGQLVKLIRPKKEDMIQKRLVFDVNGKAATIDYKSRPPRLMNANGDVLSPVKRVFSREYVLGTDTLGRDYLARILYGARISLLVAFIAASVNLLIGMLYGGISGYVGGTIDNLMMRLVDTIDTIPLTLYVILIMVVLDSGFLSIVVALGLVYWVNMARIVRGQILSLKEQEFILAARTIGVSPWGILTRHLLPNAMGPIIVTVTMLIPNAIFIEAFLSFIGLGVAAPMASWGTLCNEALEAIRSFPYQIFLPSLAICITMMAFNFLGDGLRDALDPRLRK